MSHHEAAPSSWEQESVLSFSITTAVTASLQPGPPGREEPHSASPHLISSSTLPRSRGQSSLPDPGSLARTSPDVGIRLQGARLNLQASPLIPDPWRNSSNMAERLLVDLRAPGTRDRSLHLMTSHKLFRGKGLDSRDVWASPESISAALCSPQRQHIHHTPVFQTATFQGPHIRQGERETGV